MEKLLFVVTREITNPDNQEKLIAAGQTLTVAELEVYNKQYGIDSLPCIVCVGEWAASNIRRQLGII
jgi:hypothetical protein